ncbi:MAG: alpha/beta fold hydrolase [Bacteroidota bacterium]
MGLEDQLVERDGFEFVETSPGKPVLMLLHGLFGALSNFSELIDAFKKDYNVIVPMLPIYYLPKDEAGLGGLLSFTKRFVEHFDLTEMHVLGNSLGGHIAQLLVLDLPERITSLTLTGSSGLFESGMGDGYPRRGDKDYIRKKTAETFYDPAMVTDDLVEEVFETINDRERVLRIIITAKSALKHNLADQLHRIHCPTLLVWGNQDNITPPFVGEKFHELISTSELHFVDKCGHAPMMERPTEFNEILHQFLERTRE